jgi:hypothetical protein
MLGVQVDLVFRAVQSEPDRALRGAAIQVIDEQGLHLLGPGCSIPHNDLAHHHRHDRLHKRAAATERPPATDFAGFNPAGG